MEVQIRKKLTNFTLDVDFRTEEGVFALLGASGCGKSMTLKCIAGIETPDEGRIVLDGRVLYDSEQKINLPPQERRVGYMFQDYALFPNMTVRENVMTGIRSYEQRTRKAMGRKSIHRKNRVFTGRIEPDNAYVDELLRRFHVLDVQGSYPKILSGGQKQRVAMARLVAQRPDVILLDEPFSALDSHLKWQLEQEMKTILAEEQKPTIFVSHDRDEVYHLCDTVCCLDHGHVEVIEPMKEFFANPRTKAAAILSGCKNVADAVRVDTHTLRVPEWGLVLKVKREIPEDVTAVGIRAHSVSLDTKQLKNTEKTAKRDNCVSDDTYDNRIPVQESKVLEDPFEWTISFRTGPDVGWIQWKIAKSDMPIVQIPKNLWLDSDKLMLLRQR